MSSKADYKTILEQRNVLMTALQDILLGTKFDDYHRDDDGIEDAVFYFGQGQRGENISLEHLKNWMKVGQNALDFVNQSTVIEKGLSHPITNDALIRFSPYDQDMPVLEGKVIESSKVDGKSYRYRIELHNRNVARVSSKDGVFEQSHRQASRTVNSAIKEAVGTKGMVALKNAAAIEPATDHEFEAE